MAKARLKFGYCWVGVLYAAGFGAAHGAEAPGARPIIWTAGMSAQYQKLEDFHKKPIVTGRNIALQFGGGYLGEKGYHNFSLDIYAGPYERVSNDRASLDFSGTGFGYQYGQSIGAASIRNPSGVFGVSLAFTYLDVVGRSIGQNQEQRELAQPTAENTDITETTRDYVVKVTSFAVVPALFYARFQPERPKGNTPELLETRLEGFIVALGLALPAYSTHITAYTKRVDEGAPEKVKERGRLKGSTLMLTLTGILGV